MSRHSVETIRNIKVLRKKGMSMSEIMLETGLSKTTIWHHIRDVKLDSATLQKIRRKQGGSKERMERSFAKAQIEAKAILAGKKSFKELSYLVSMLYWAEGSKRELVFTNTDISMINMYVLFITKVLKIKTSDIYMLIRISDPINPDEALKFWVKGTGITRSNIKTNHNNVQNKTKTTYGICRVYTRKGGYSLKVIQCMIQIVKNTYCPCSSMDRTSHS